MKLISDREEVPLERSARKAMMASDRQYRELDEEEDDDEESSRRRKRNDRGGKDDVVLEESYNILMDLIRLNGGKELPRAKGLLW